MVATIGEVRLKVSLDRSGVRKGLEDIQQLAQTELKIKSNLGSLRTELAKIGRKPLEVAVKADLSGIRSDIAKLTSQAAKVAVTIDTRGIKRSIAEIGDQTVRLSVAVDSREVKRSIDAIGDRAIKITAGLDTRNVRKSLNDIGDQSIRVRAELDTRGINNDLKALDEISDRKVKIRAELNTRDLRKSLTDIDEQSIDVKTKVDTRGVKRALDNIGEQTVKVKVDGRGVQRAISDLDGSAVKLRATVDTAAVKKAIDDIGERTVKVQIKADIAGTNARRDDSPRKSEVNTDQIQKAVAGSVRDGFARAKPSGGIVGASIGNVIRGAQEQVGAAFSAKTANRAIQQLEKEFNFSLESIGQKSAERLAKVARFAGDRVTTRVGEKFGIEGGAEGFRQAASSAIGQVREIGAEVIDTKKLEAKLTVLELAIGRTLDNIVSNAFELKVDPKQLGRDISGIGSAVGDVGRTPLEGLADRRQRQLEASFRKAQELAKQIQVPDISDDKALTFTIGGFAGNRGQSSPGVADRLQTLLQGKSTAIPVANTETDTSVNVGAGPKFFAQIGQRFFKQNVVKGYNEDAIRTAAYAIAAKNQRPDIPVNIAGYSAGGFVANEASQILRKGGIDAPAVGIGTPRLGLTDRLDDKNFQAVLANTEQLNKLTMLFNRTGAGTTQLDIAGDHKLASYLGAPEAQSAILGQLGLDTNVPSSLKGPAAFELPSLEEDYAVIFQELQRNLSDPKAALFTQKSGTYKVYIDNIQKNRDKLAKLIEQSQGETLDAIVEADEAFAQAEELFKAQFGVKQPSKPVLVADPTKRSIADPPANQPQAATKTPLVEPIPSTKVPGLDLELVAVPTPPIAQAKAFDFGGSISSDSKELDSALAKLEEGVAFKRRSAAEIQAGLTKELNDSTVEILKEIGRVAGLGTIKGKKADIIKELTTKVDPAELSKSIAAVDPLIEVGPKGGRKLKPRAQTEGERSILAITAESEKRIQAALQVMQTAQGKRRAEIAELIANENAQTIAQLNRLTSKAVAPETRKAAGAQKGRLTAIDNQLPTISGAARVSPRDILRKVDPSTLEDLGVAAVGFAGSQIGAQLGITGQMGGELAAALAARQALEIGKATVKAARSIKGSGRALTPKTLFQEARLNFIAGDNQKKLGNSITGDVAGFAIGNTVSQASKLIPGGDLIRQVASTALPLAAAVKGAPRVQAARRSFVDRFREPEIEGVARVDDAPSEQQQQAGGILAKFKTQLANQFKSKKLDAEKVYQILLEETAKASGVALNPRDIPALKVDDSKLEQLGAVGFFKIKDNQVLIRSELEKVLSGTVHDMEMAQKELLTIVHENRHALQFDFGRLSIRDIGQNPQQSPVALYQPQSADNTAKFNALRSVDVARKQSPLASKTTLGGIYRTELDAYAFERNRGQSVIDRTLDRVKGGEGRANAFSLKLPEVEVPQWIQQLSNAAKLGSASIKGLGGTFDGLIASASAVSPGLGKIANGLKGVAAGAFSLIAVQQAAKFMLQFAQSSIEASRANDRLTNSLAAVQGSSKKATENIATVDAEASRFGLDRKTAREGFVQLAASTKGTAIEGEKTTELQTAISALSASRSIDPERQKNAVVALSQIAAKGGAASAEEVRGQLAEALPGSSGIAARGLGLTTKEFNRKLNAGQIESTDFLEAFTKQASAESLGAAEKNAGTLNGQLNELGNTTQALQEKTGNAISPAFSAAIGVATGGLKLLLASASVLGPLLGSIALVAGSNLVSGLIASGIAAKGLGVAAGIAGAGLQAALSAAPQLLVAFVAIKAASVAFEALSSAFTLDLSGDIQAFKDLGDAGVKELERIEEARKNTGKASIVGERDGKEFTKNKKNLTSINFIDLIPGARLFDKDRQDALKAVDRNADNKKAFNETITDFNKISAGLTTTESSTEARKSLESTKAIDRERAQLRSRRNLLSSDKANEPEINQIDEQLKLLDVKRKEAFKPAESQQKLASANLAEIRQQIENTKSDESISGKERERRLTELNKTAAEYEKINKSYAGLSKEIGVSSNPIATLNEKLSELKLKLDDIQNSAKIKLDIQLANSAEDLNKNIKTDRFASTANAAQVARQTADSAKSQFEQSRSAVDQLNKDIDSEDLKTRLSEITVGATGRTISKDSSLADIELASQGAGNDEKRVLGLLKELREAEAQLPQQQREAAQAETGAIKATEADELNRLDDGVAEKTLARDKAIAADRIALQKQVASNAFASAEDEAIAQAELSKSTAASALSANKAQQYQLEELKNKGVLTAEEYTKRKRSLLGEETQLAEQAANAEVEARQAANQKILADLQRRQRDRALALKERGNTEQIAITKAEIDPNVSTEDTAIARAEAGSRATDGELANTQAALSDLNEAYAKGAIKADEYKEKQADLKSQISDLGLKKAQDELAIRQAINAKILKEFEIAKSIRELDARQSNNTARTALVRRQINGNPEKEDVAIDSAKLDIAATNRQVGLANAELSDLNAAFAKGALKVDEYNEKTRAIKGTLSDLGLQGAQNELALREAINAKILKGFETAKKAAEASIDRRSSDASFTARSTQFRTGEVTGEGGAAETAKIERKAIQERLALRRRELGDIRGLVAQRVITESEAKDRILAIEADIRQQRSALLDSQIQKFEQQTQVKIDLINREADAAARAFEAEKSQLSKRSSQIEKQTSLLSAQAEQAKALADTRLGALSGREADLGSQRQLAQRSQSSDVGANERAEIKRQTGGADELTILKNQQAVSREIEAEKVAALNSQQAFAKTILEQEQARLRIAQKIAEIEAKSAQVRAVAASASARLELAKAEKTGDRNQIAAARSAVKAADQGTALATDNVGLTQDLGESLEKELNVREKTLGIQQRNERADLFRSNLANEKGRRIDLAQTLDKSGKSESLGNFAVAGADFGKPTREVNVEPLANSQPIEQLSSTIAGLDVAGLQALLKQIAENTSKQGNAAPVTNNFNGGKDAVQQYTKLKNAEYNAAVRNS